VAWSPDGTSLLVSSDRSGTYDIYRVPLDGSGDAELVLATPGDSWVNDWSADGRIAFVSMVDENADIWVGAADGTGSANVLPTDTDDWFPSFTRSGALVFNTNRYGRSSEIAMLPAGSRDLTYST
jgi:TolB protein